MKTLLIISLLLFTSCSSKVYVKMSSCEEIVFDLHKCEEVK